MRIVLASALLMTLVACGSSSSDDSPAAAPADSGTWTNKEMQSLVATNCAISGCHNGTQAPNYTNISEANMKADTAARSQVASGAMPQGGTLSASQKATFEAFYK